MKAIHCSLFFSAVLIRSMIAAPTLFQTPPPQSCPGGTVPYDMTPDSWEGKGSSDAEAQQNAWDTWPGVPPCPECASPAHECIQTRAPSGSPVGDISWIDSNGVYHRKLTYRPTVTMNQTCDC